MKKLLIVFVCLLAHTQFYAQVPKSIEEKALAAGRIAANVTNVAAQTLGSDNARAAGMTTGRAILKGESEDKAQEMGIAVGVSRQEGMDNGENGIQADARGTAVELSLRAGVDPQNLELLNQKGDVASQAALENSGKGGLAAEMAGQAAAESQVRGESADQSLRIANNTGDAAAAQSENGTAAMRVSGTIAESASRVTNDDNAVADMANFAGTVTVDNLAQNNGLATSMRGAEMAGETVVRGGTTDLGLQVNGNTTDVMRTALQNPDMGMFSAEQGGTAAGNATMEGQGDRAPEIGDTVANTSQNLQSAGVGEAGAGAGAAITFRAASEGKENAAELGEATGMWTQGQTSSGVAPTIAGAAAEIFGNALITTGNEELANTAGNVAATAGSRAAAAGQGEDSVEASMNTSSDFVLQAGTAERQPPAAAQAQGEGEGEQGGQQAQGQAQGEEEQGGQQPQGQAQGQEEQGGPQPQGQGQEEQQGTQFGGGDTGEFQGGGDMGGFQGGGNNEMPEPQPQREDN